MIPLTNQLLHARIKACNTRHSRRRCMASITRHTSARCPPTSPTTMLLSRCRSARSASCHHREREREKQTQTQTPQKEASRTCLRPLCVCPLHTSFYCEHTTFKCNAMAGHYISVLTCILCTRVTQLGYLSSVAKSVLISLCAGLHARVHA